MLLVVGVVDDVIDSGCVVSEIKFCEVGELLVQKEIDKI